MVKNVTGYDLSKGVTGSYGTLAVLTDITMKVLPKSETEQTLVLDGLSDAEASDAMAQAMGSNAEVSGAAHIPAGVVGGKASTLLRLEGFAPSVEYRIENLGKMLSTFGKHERLDEQTSRAQWWAVRDCIPFAGNQEKVVWRISGTPSQGHLIVEALRNVASTNAFYDWQGGLIWLQMNDGDANAELVRNAVKANGGGHSTLVRANAATRQTVPVFEPQPGPLGALSKRYRENFDPNGVLNPGRMGT